MAAGNMADSVPGNTPPSGNAAGMNIVGKESSLSNVALEYGAGAATGVIAG